MAHIVQKYVYAVSKQFKQVRHYNCINKPTDLTLLTSSINISKNRRFNNSKDASYFLKIRKGNKWNSNVTSGLIRTHKPLIYYGDIPIILNNVYKKTHLLIFIFNNGGTELTIHLFKNYYPNSKKELQIIISRYLK